MKPEIELGPVQLPAEIVADHVIAGGDQLTTGVLSQLTAVAMVMRHTLHVSRVSQPAKRRNTPRRVSGHTNMGGFK